MPSIFASAPFASLKVVTGMVWLLGERGRGLGHVATRTESPNKTRAEHHSQEDDYHSINFISFIIL